MDTSFRRSEQSKSPPWLYRRSRPVDEAALCESSNSPSRMRRLKTNSSTLQYNSILSFTSRRVNRWRSKSPLQKFPPRLPQRGFNTTTMSKRMFNETHEPVSLDDAFRSLKAKKAMDRSLAKGEVVKDPANIMDDWYSSSKELRAQRHSPKQTEREAWTTRNALNAPVVGKVPGNKGRNRDRTKQFFSGLADAPRSFRKRPTRSSSQNQTPGDNSTPVSLTGDFSWICREFWLVDRGEYISKVYRILGVDSQIPVISEENMWKIFHYLISELVPIKKRQDPSHIIAEPNTIWQVGRGMLQILTGGRFWDWDDNVINPVDAGENFGHYKQKVLRAKYSRNLMKYVLACLTTHEKARPTQGELLHHFGNVFSVYKKTYRPAHENLSLLDPYISKDLRVPRGLDKEEVLAYEAILGVGDSQPLGTKRPQIIVITDLAKDYDDLTAMMILKELERLGFVDLVGFVANLMPSAMRAQFGRGALDELGLQGVPIAAGTRGEEDDKKEHEVQSYEFAGSDKFLKTNEPRYEGQEFLTEKLKDAATTGKKLTLLAISSLLDIGTFCETHPDILSKGLEKVIFQGGYFVENGELKPDFAATNNKFAPTAATKFHKFLSDYGIPSTAYTKVATFATPIDNSLFLSLESTRNKLGVYLRQCQLGQDLAFYKKACNTDPKQRFAPFMDQAWYLKNKSGWAAAGHEPDEPGPEGDEVVQYLTSVTAYDALAALGTAGDEVLKALEIPKSLIRRPDVKDNLHHIVGVPLDRNLGLPEEVNMDGEKMAVAIYALLKGSLLAVEQGLGKF